VQKSDFLRELFKANDKETKDKNKLWSTDDTENWLYNFIKIFTPNIDVYGLKDTTYTEYQKIDFKDMKDYLWKVENWKEGDYEGRAKQKINDYKNQDFLSQELTPPQKEKDADSFLASVDDDIRPPSPVLPTLNLA
jgi:hypothetical protein